MGLHVGVEHVSLDHHSCFLFIALLTASWRQVFSAKAFRLLLVHLLSSHLPELSKGLLGTGTTMKNAPGVIFDSDDFIIRLPSTLEFLEFNHKVGV